MNDAEAIRRCQNGEREAFHYLVEGYKNVLYGTAYLMTGNRSTAEESVQECFLAAWRGIGGFRDGRPVKPWLVRILVNTIISQRRRRSITSAPLEEAMVQRNTGHSADMAERVANQQHVRQALVSLSEEHRRLVFLRYFTDLSVPQIARVLGWREGTVKSRLYRTLRHLREVMEE